MNGVGITYLWVNKEFPPFVRLEGKRGDYEVYVPERTCENVGDEISGECSECRGWLDPGCAYCPSCGAKVVIV